MRGSNFYVCCVGYMGQNIFYVGHHFTWVIIFLRGLHGSNILFGGSKFFAWVQQFLIGSIFGGESKKKSCLAFSQ